MAVLGITCRRRHEQGLRRGLTADRPRTGTAAPDAGRQAPPDSGRPSARAPGRKDRGEARAQGTAPEAMATAAGASESRPVMRSAPAGPPPTSRRALARTPSSCRHPLPVVTSRECRLSPASWWSSEKLLLKGNVVVVERGTHTGVLFCLGCTGGFAGGIERAWEGECCSRVAASPSRPLPWSPHERDAFRLKQAGGGKA